MPEDDLPHWALPEGYVAGISMASTNLKREGTIKRLAEAGYSVDLCKQVLEFHQDDESKAAEALQLILISSGHIGAIYTSCISIARGISVDNLDSVWEEELSSLDSVFGGKYSGLQPKYAGYN